MSDEQMQRLMGALADRAPDPERDALTGVRRRLRRRARARWGGTAVVAGVAALAIIGSILTGPPGAGTSAVRGSIPMTALPPVRLAGALTSFDSCPALLTYLHEQASAQMTPDGLVGGPVVALQAGGTPSAAGAAAVPQGARPAAVPGHSATTTQVADVDEPDLAKTDGHLLVTLDGQVLHVIDAARAVSLGQVALPVQADVGLLLVGSRAVVLGHAGATPKAVSTGSGTVVSIVDLADPQRPRVVRSTTFDAELAGARLVHGAVRLALTTSAPVLAWSYPRDASAAAQQQALATNRALVRATTLDQWLPSWHSSDGGSGQVSACSDVARPVHAGALGTASLLTIDPSVAAPGPGVSVVGAGQTVYAEGTDAYLAGQRWSPEAGRTPLGAGAAGPAQIGTGAPVPAPGGAGASTDLYRFDLSDPSRARFVAAATVPGGLLGIGISSSQASYSLSQDHGVLRVTTTDRSSASGTSETIVTTLATRGDRLVRLGSVGGIGRGEDVYAVRYLGATAYIVTYLQTDPMTVVDLTDPAHPAVRGVLQVPGVSTTLLPLPDHRLLGVGHLSGCDACAHPPGGAVVTSGLQLSLFDVSVVGRPRLLHREVLPGAFSLAEQDPHALLSWPPTGLVALPVDTYLQTLDVRTGLRLGAVVAGDGAQALRGLVVGARLFTVTDGGIVVSDLGTLHKQASLRW